MPTASFASSSTDCASAEVVGLAPLGDRMVLHEASHLFTGSC